MLHSDQDIRNRLLLARLPAMPQILIKLIERLQADDMGMPELAALIASDPGMAAKVLAVANSSAYHRSRSIGLEQALVALGTDMIKLLVIGESVTQTFHNFPHSGSIDLRHFWQHSLTAALVARALARHMAYPQPEEAYLAGLLHNVGRLALLATAPQEYAFHFSARDDEQLCAVEQRTLQITHAEAGAWLIERWQFDSFLADAVLYHHEPGERLSHSHPLIRIVRLAHVLATGDASDDETAAAAALCGLAPDAARVLLDTAARQLAQLATQLGIDLAGQAPLPPPATVRDATGQRLAQEVGQRALVAEAGQVFARQQGEGALIDAVTRAARILFGFTNAVILVDDPAGQRLVGTPSCAQQRSAGFAVALDGKGALASAARSGQVMAAHATDPGLAEQQLLRILGGDSMACIPLMAGGRCLGVLAGAGPASPQRAGFMLAFGAQAAAAMEAALAGRGHARRQLAHAADEYRAASRRVAHEVNNPLAIIRNYLGVLDEKLARHENVAGEVAILSEEIDRVGQLINGMAGWEQTPPATAGIGRVIEDVVRLFSASAGAVQLDADVSADCSDAGCDPALVKQVLINLVKNAAEAMPAGGRITLSCRSQQMGAGQRVLALSVADDGPGLPPQVLAGLFAPVASSKGSGRGLGLSIVHRLVEGAGGSIGCRSSAGGTVFELQLPALEEVA